MNQGTSLIQDLKTIGKLPEMRLFWIYLPFLLIIIVINFIYLPIFLALASSAISFIIAGLVFFIASRIARLNHEITLERNELKNIILGFEDALIAYDQQFHILFFNPAAERLFNVSAQETIGSQLQPKDAENPRFQRLVQVMFPSLAPVMIPRSSAGAHPQILDLSFTDPILELRVSTSPIADDRGKILGFIKIVRDRTREVTLMKSKDEFITVASHQLRTPITEISWALEAISGSKDLIPADREVVMNALTASKELIQINEDLLDTAKIEEGHFGYQIDEMSIMELVNRVLAEVKPLMDQAGIKLYLDKPEAELPKVHADKHKIEMVLNNLLENALRYNVQHGEVTVKVEKEATAPFVKVSVRDTGIGIGPEDTKKMFTKFFRADTAMKAQTKGSGLGLYIAKNIIRAHGGQMGVESEMNRGSNFYFTLPTEKSLIPTRELPLEY